MNQIVSAPKGALRISRERRGVYRLTTELLVDRPIDEVFEFFSDPRNLENITPGWLTLRVRTRERIVMRKGTRIRYRFRVRGVPAIWHSEITAWEPPHRFVDEQSLGPFRMWVHEHTFEEIDGRTLARDSVTYKVPGGRLLHGLFVEKDLRRLFGFRHDRLLQIFPSPAAG
ncbi:MAG TPA: SRPBCC family protein [Actinomycetota bacterium]|nr:SRPBCC family protein [Actinomycetota bacterium]